MCCETCPAVFHMECLGLASLPAGDWWCPWCVCAVCGKSHFEREHLPEASKQVHTHTLFWSSIDVHVSCPDVKLVCSNYANEASLSMGHVTLLIKQLCFIAKALTASVMVSLIPVYKLCRLQIVHIKAGLVSVSSAKYCCSTATTNLCQHPCEGNPLRQQLAKLGASVAGHM